MSQFGDKVAIKHDPLKKQHILLRKDVGHTKKDITKISIRQHETNTGITA